MLRKIRVQGFKSLHDVEIGLAPLVVLFGPNAVGKSNVLEALLLLSRVATERTLGDALGPPLRGYPLEAFSLPRGGLADLLKQDSATLALDALIDPVAAADGARQDTLDYRVGIEIRPKTGELVVVDEYLARMNRVGAAKGLPRIEPEHGQLVVRRLGEAGHPRQEPLGLNHTLASNMQFTGSDRYPDFDRLRAELAAWRIYYLDPRVAMRQAQPPRDVSDIGTQGEWLAPFLYRLMHDPARKKFFQAIGRGLRAAIPSIDALDVDLDPQRGTLDIQVSQDHTRYSSRVVSEGTLRVLALCAIAASPWPGTLVAFEEPENGVHPRRIEVTADLLYGMIHNGRRQVVVTTHSPTLLAAMVRRAREATEGSVRLLQCTRVGDSTAVREFTPTGELFDTDEIRDGLLSQDDDRIIEAMLLRGWLDGG